MRTDSNRARVCIKPESGSTWVVVVDVKFPRIPQNYPGSFMFARIREADVGCAMAASGGILVMKIGDVIPCNFSLEVKKLH